jgi:NADPH2:quinone reductase
MPDRTEENRLVNQTMRAVVLEGPGPAEALKLTDVPIPSVAAGSVLIRVHAFGLNRSELHLRQGVAGNASFPRIPGIEAAGVVAHAPGGEVAEGTQVVTMMGGMGREFDGGYAEYVAVPAPQVIPLSSRLDWATLGAIPEMLQTAYGSLLVGVRARPGNALLVRGGTSSVGMALIVLAKRMGVTVLATTRRAANTTRLLDLGADHVLVDDRHLAAAVHQLREGGVDGAVELVGTNTLPDTLRATRPGGTVCFTGMLSDSWTIPDFYPMDYIPNGVRLTAYHGEASDLPSAALQAFIDDAESGRARVPIGHIYDLTEIVQAHRDLESSAYPGKLVVLVPEE